MSKKWASQPAIGEDGKPLLTKSGKPVLRKSYSILQDDFYNAMQDAGYTDLERGERGSSEEHLTVTQFKVKREQERLNTLTERTEEKAQEAAALEKKLQHIQRQQADVNAVEQIEAKPAMLSTTKVTLERREYEALKIAAKKYVVQERREGKLQKTLDAAKRLICELKAEIASLKKELLEYKSVYNSLRTAELERENSMLRKKLGDYESVIQRNNLWHFFRQWREKTAERDEVR